jgi:3-oxoacyl-[acyl-carrier-protein] synthase-1
MVLSDSNPEGLLPVHLYDGEFDPEIPAVHLVRQGDRCKGIRRIQSNSFAFGGCNVSLIVEKV